MKKKLFAIIASLLLIVTSIYAGTKWIDYATGEFGCSNNTFQGQVDACKKSSGQWNGHDYCQLVAERICKPF